MAYNMFSDLKDPIDVTKYTLFRGTTDFTQLGQFNLYESGFPYLVVVSVPEFLSKMAGSKDETGNSVRSLLKSYIHTLEYEFKGFENGIDNISTDLGTIDNGFQQMNVITKSNFSSQNFSMRYYEKAGSVLTKMHELYLRSVRDPGSGFKTYNGLIGSDVSKVSEEDIKKGTTTPIYTPNDVGFDKECFSFLYMHTDNTGLALERAVYIVGAAPTTAQLDIYNGTKGTVEFQEVTCEFTGFPIMGAAVNKRAKEILDWMNDESNNLHVRRNSWDFEYEGVTGKNMFDSNKTAVEGLYRDELTNGGSII